MFTSAPGGPTSKTFWLLRKNLRSGNVRPMKKGAYRRWGLLLPARPNKGPTSKSIPFACAFSRPRRLRVAWRLTRKDPLGRRTALHHHHAAVQSHSTDTSCSVVARSRPELSSSSRPTGLLAGVFLNHQKKVCVVTLAALQHEGRVLPPRALFSSPVDKDAFY